MSVLYDKIGLNYANLRKPDPRIGTQISVALGNPQSVINVGAGAGSYEPSDRDVIAVEPSRQMINQRYSAIRNVVQAQAEALPFRDDTFDAARAVLTVHHWGDQQKGIGEMLRVASEKLVIVTFDPLFRGFWLADYFPEIVTIDEAQMPPIEKFQSLIGPIVVHPIFIPHDCSDGFLGAYWRRPAAYLDEKVRAAISSFWAMDDISAGLDRLEHDLKTDVWQQRYGHLFEREQLDVGYRMITATIS
ncbi:MAG: methyltransferase domain-containing protein [Pseudomonadota bacterium]